MLDFIRFAFHGEAPPPRSLEVAERRILELAGEVERLSGRRPRTGAAELHQIRLRSQGPVPVSREQVQAAVVATASKVMSLVLVLSLAAVVVLAVLGKAQPDVLTVGVTVPLGYFGGLLSSYFGIRNR